MQITAVAALLSLAATGLAAPVATAFEGVSTLSLRAGDVSIPKTSRGAVPPPDMLAFENGEEKDYKEEDGGGNDDEDLLSGITPAVEKRKFNKGLPGRDALHVQIGGVVGGLARVQYKGEDFVTGGYNSQKAHCSVGKSDQPWIYKDRYVTNLDCGFTC